MADSGAFGGGGGLMPPLPSANPNFVMMVFKTIHQLCSSKTSKFRHSLTNKLQLPSPRLSTGAKAPLGDPCLPGPLSYI